LRKFATNFTPLSGPHSRGSCGALSEAGQRGHPPQLAFKEDRSTVYQDRQSHSLSVGGTRSLGSQKPCRLPMFTIAPLGGSGGVTCAGSGS